MLNNQLRRSQYSIDVCSSRDAWTHGAALRGWDHQYGQVRPGAFTGMFNVAWLGPVQLVYERVDHAFNYRGRAWKGARIFFSYLLPSGGIFYDNRSVGAGGLTTHRWDAVERVSCNRQMELVLVAIDEQFLTEYLAAVPGLEHLTRNGAPACYAPAQSLISTFQRTVCGVLQELVEQPALLRNERTRVGLQQRVLDTIIQVVADPQAGTGRLSAPLTRAYIAGRAIDFIESRLADPISIRDICARIRICPRTLSYAFSEVLGTSPKSYLLAARLNKVQRDLADARVHGSIQGIATRWGFSHMGRFAQYYRAAFGERPSDTYRARSFQLVGEAPWLAGSSEPQVSVLLGSATS